MVLYINNFRGFKNTFIPIKDVNFLVGENSTGKTSVLKLIKLLNSDQFWDYQKFQTEDFKFTSFDEICSDKKSNSFEIGIYLNPGYQYRDYIYALKIKFGNVKDSPVIEEVRFLYYATEIEIRWNNSSNSKQIRYKYDETAKLFNGATEFSFTKWILKNDLEQIAFEDYGKPTLGGQSVFNLLNEIRSHILPILANGNHGLKLGKGAVVQPPSNYLIWFAPIRTESRKTYDSNNIRFQADGGRFPYLLRQIINGMFRDDQKIISLLRSFGKASGLFEDIGIKEYDKDLSSPFEVQVTLDKTIRNLTNVGYGVSQALPILVEILSGAESSSYALQQPETHLHPKAQAALAEFFYRSWLTENKQFFIETHSDYLMDRFRIVMSKSKRNHKKHADKCHILFFSRDKEGNKVDSIEIGEDGKYLGELPKEFGDFFVKEEMDFYSLNFD